MLVQRLMANTAVCSKGTRMRLLYGRWLAVHFIIFRFGNSCFMSLVYTIVPQLWRGRGARQPLGACQAESVLDVQHIVGAREVVQALKRLIL